VTFEAFERPHYYTQFFDGKPDVTLVHGPNEIAMMFESACTEVKATYAKQKWQATFQDLAALRDGLRANFGCLPHTAELVGLRSENGIHKKTVDLHTADVVGKLHSLPAFAKLDAGAQLLVEVAAWLHDIGKGPRSRWANNGGLQKVDPNHPVGAMPMMVEILTRHVAPIDPADARTLMKLVCYHDLVGDVLGKGRDEQQIIDVVESRRELDMLFALGEADATVLVEAWWDGFKAFALHTRCRNAI
jgi:UTP:GlnB (protein PII) uridylyltransferase